MQRLLLIGASMAVLLLANVAGLTPGAVLATLGIGLLTAVCLVPVVLLCEIISRGSGRSRSHRNGPAL